MGTGCLAFPWRVAEGKTGPQRCAELLLDTPRAACRVLRAAVLRAACCVPRAACRVLRRVLRVACRALRASRAVHSHMQSHMQSHYHAERSASVSPAATGTYYMVQFYERHLGATVCVRACVRARVHACLCVCACVCVHRDAALYADSSLGRDEGGKGGTEGRGVGGKRQGR